MKKYNVQLIAMSPDSPEYFQSFDAYKKHNVMFLSDDEMNAAREFGVAFQLQDKDIEFFKGHKVELDKVSGHTHFQLPAPSIFIVDANGIVRFVHIDADYTTRISAEKVQQVVHAVLA